MAMLPPLPSPSSSSSSSSSLHISHCPHRLLLFYHRQLLPNSKAILPSSATRAADPNTTPTPTDSDSETNPDSPKSDPDRFESRLSQVRLRYRSGTGKKAEIRKNRKSTSYSKKGSSSSSSSGSGVLLPPVPLREQVSADGLKVEFGFSPYSERVNGWIAGLGLAALLLVELATGKSVIKYHTPAIVFVQVYFVSAVSALYLKYEKERQSIWPQAMK